jgi:kynurenine formamidase
MNTLKLLSAVALCSCATAGRAGHAGQLDLAQASLADLTHAYNSQSLFWPASPPDSFQLTELSHGQTDHGYFYSAYKLSTPEHGGTHLDAPIHFAENGQTADQIPLERLVAPAVVIDVSKQEALQFQ